MPQTTTQVMSVFLICLHIYNGLHLIIKESLKIIMIYKIIQKLVDITKSNYYQHLINTALDVKRTDIYNEYSELMCITIPFSLGYKCMELYPLRNLWFTNFTIIQTQYRLFKLYLTLQLLYAMLRIILFFRVMHSKHNDNNSSRSHTQFMYMRVSTSKARWC